jgi:hypothetical protein
VSDGRSSAITSGNGRHRDNSRRTRTDDGKNTYRWNHAICASSQDWAGPPVWLKAGTADRERKSQTTKARSRRPVRLRQARYWHSRIGETLTRYLSEGSGAVDKLGMMRCVVCQAGPFRIWRLRPLQAPRLNTASCGPQPRRATGTRSYTGLYLEFDCFQEPTSISFTCCTAQLCLPYNRQHHVTPRPMCPSRIALSGHTGTARMLACRVTLFDMQGSQL